MMKLERLECTDTPRTRRGTGEPDDGRSLPVAVADVTKETLKRFPHSKRVGSYFLGKTLGEGSFAKVKEAMHLLSGEKVAVKCIDKKKAKEDIYVRKNMRREGKLLQMVRHRHVIRLYETMETENSYYLVTELCQGGDLMDYICAQKKLSESETKRFIRQIISAVHYLHSAGILHRDLKVENLLLDENKDIKIIDFGLSNTLRVNHTKDGATSDEFCVTQCGSPAYAAPELLGNKKYDNKVDIWSIGVNMFAMLTGNLPFTVEPFNIKALHQKMLDGNMNPLPESLSKDGCDFIKRLLNPDPEKRMSLPEAMQHPWVLDANGKPMQAAPFPNKLSADELLSNIVNHMAQKLGFRLSEVIRLVTANVPSSATATYHLFYQRLSRYNDKMRTRDKMAADELVSSSRSTQNTSGYASRDDVIDLVPLGNIRHSAETASNRKSNDVTKVDDIYHRAKQKQLPAKDAVPGRLLQRETNKVTFDDESHSASKIKGQSKEEVKKLYEINNKNDRPATSLPKAISTEGATPRHKTAENRALSAWNSDRAKKAEGASCQRDACRYKYTTKGSDLPAIAEKPASQEILLATRVHLAPHNAGPSKHADSHAARPRPLFTATRHHVASPPPTPSAGQKANNQCWTRADPESATEREAAGGAPAPADGRQTITAFHRRSSAERTTPPYAGRQNGRFFNFPATKSPFILPQGGAAAQQGKRLPGFGQPANNRTRYFSTKRSLLAGRQLVSGGGALRLTDARSRVANTPTHTPDGATSTPRQSLDGAKTATPSADAGSDGISLPVITSLFNTNSTE